MKKKLKLRIAKFDCVHITEILCKEGKFPNTKHTEFEEGFQRDENEFFYASFFSPSKLDAKTFGSAYSNNQERDDTVQNMIDWITNEQFNGASPTIEGEIYTWEDEQ